MAEPCWTLESTSAIATRILVAPPGSASATDSWSRSRESSLSIEHHGFSRRSRVLGIDRAEIVGQLPDLGHRGVGEVGRQAALQHRPVRDGTQVASHVAHDQTLPWTEAPSGQSFRGLPGERFDCFSLLSSARVLRPGAITRLFSRASTIESPGRSSRAGLRGDGPAPR